MATQSKQKTTHVLEMSQPAALRPAGNLPQGVIVLQVEQPDPEYNWFLYHAVGTEFRWGGRSHWGRAEWMAHAESPDLEVWVAYWDGAPAGYYELVRQSDGSVQILCFGLLSRFIGRGLGRTLLTRAVGRCWEMGANRVWLTTCTHDHPHALPNYQARGFQVVETRCGPANPERPSPFFRHD